MSPDEYLAAAGACRTVNAFNRLHIDLENELAPADLAALWSLRKRPEFPEQSKSWLRVVDRLEPSILDAPSSFRRRRLLARAQLYSDEVPVPGKGLLVAFCGSTDRLGVPIAAILQSLDPASWDVVKVTRDRGRSYLRGWTEGPRGFRGILRAVAKAAGAAGYPHVATLGTSSGGVAALIAARRLGARNAVAIGARSPDARRRIKRLVWLHRPRASSILAYGALNGMDRRSAEAFGKLLGGTLLPVTGTDRHNLIHHLLKLGRLPDLLRDVLDAPLDPAALRRWTAGEP